MEEKMGKTPLLADGTLRHVRTLYEERLMPMYGIGEARSLFYWTVRELWGKSRLEVVQCLDRVLSDRDRLEFVQVLERLSVGEPVQYVFSKAYFADMELRVDSSVLIPRPETEELWDWAVTSIRDYFPSSIGGNVPLRIGDLCTGSGALALALARSFPKAEVYACDLSDDALAVARENNRTCGTSVRFFRYDVLSDSPLCLELPLASFHLIVSNPPYVRPSERDQMRTNVLGYEPGMALFVPEDDPLVFYRAIAALGKKYLCRGGILLEEINEAFPEENRSLLEYLDFRSVSVRTDMQGKPRMIRAFR